MRTLARVALFTFFTIGFLAFVAVQSPRLEHR